MYIWLHTRLLTEYNNTACHIINNSTHVLRECSSNTDVEIQNLHFRDIMMNGEKAARNIQTRSMYQI